MTRFLKGLEKVEEFIIFSRRTFCFSKGIFTVIFNFLIKVTINLPGLDFLHDGTPSISSWLLALFMSKYHNCGHIVSSFKDPCIHNLQNHEYPQTFAFDNFVLQAWSSFKINSWKREQKSFVEKSDRFDLVRKSSCRPPDAWFASEYSDQFWWKFPLQFNRTAGN